MKILSSAVLLVLAMSSLGRAQDTFVVTGTPIPSDLLHQNFGSVPKGISAYDLNICNVTAIKQSVVSSEIYQALSRSNAELQPIGRQIMLASILRSQNRSAANLLSIALNSATGMLSVLSSSKYSVPTGLLTGAALGSLAAQQLVQNLKPILSADQLEKFEDQVLEPALVLDSGSCVERTVFTLNGNPKLKASSLSFHVR